MSGTNLSSSSNDNSDSSELLRLAQKRMGSLLRSLPVGIVIVNSGGLIEATNPAMVSLFSCSESELVGQDAATLFKNSYWGPEQECKSIGEWCHKQDVQPIEIEAKTKEWEVFPVDLSISVLDGAGSDRFLISLVDVTARVNANRLREEFIAMVSHDIRTPLTSLSTFLELLSSPDDKYGQLSDVGRSRLQTVSNSIDRVIALVNQLLYFEQLEQDSVQLSPAPVSLLSVVQQSLEIVELLATHKQIEITSDVDDDSIVADELRLSQVLVNVLSNAIEHTPSGGAINVQGRTAGGVTEIIVSDSGPGIAVEDALMIFEPFRQSSRKKGKGYGLGLAICKRLIKLHRGDISCAPGKNGGTTFSITIPQPTATR